MDEHVKSWGLMKVAVTAGLVVALGFLALKLLLPDASTAGVMGVLMAVVMGAAEEIVWRVPQAPVHHWRLRPLKFCPIYPIFANHTDCAG